MLESFVPQDSDHEDSRNPAVPNLVDWVIDRKNFFFF